MKWSFSIARIAGTEVRLHLTFVIFIVAVAIQYYFTSGILPALQGTVLLLGVFLCVLLHEFGHVAAALRFGITTPRITLLPIGGVAGLTRIPKIPMQELLVAIAGPAVNIVIALVLIAIRGGVPQWPPSGAGGEFSMLDSLIWINIALVVFNMIPAFPMDGGRVFRALLTMLMPRVTATHFAARLGQGIAIAGGIWALGTGHLFLALIAVFIFLAGKGEETLVDQESLLEGRSADDAAMSEFHTFQLDDPLRDVIQQILAGDQDCFPVVSDSGDCVAAINFNQVLAAFQHYGEDARVRDAVDAIPPQIKADAPAFDAFQKLVRSRMPGAAVVDENGRLKKWLTTRQFSEFMALCALRE